MDRFEEYEEVEFCCYGRTEKGANTPCKSETCKFFAYNAQTFISTCLLSIRKIGEEDVDKIKKYNLNWWCRRTWIKVELVIAFIITALILINWECWETDLKIVAAIAALIPLHVVEEWVFPGGFHYQYNISVYKSEKPNHYPMCRLSDMYTNMLATVFYVVLTILCVLRDGHVDVGILMGTAIFSFLELFMHTFMGIKMYFRFRDKGKTTIYGPGSVTAYFGFVPLGIIAIYNIIGKVITTTDMLICIGILLYIVVICILIPENTIKTKDTKYYFESAGYFERFL